MSEPEIGTVMEDKTIYVGRSPETGNGLFVMPADVGMLVTEKLIVGRIEAFNASEVNGHSDWRLPTFKELKIIFENKEKGALKGTFNETAERNKPFTPPIGRSSPGWYRTSDPGSGFTTKGIFFSDGEEESMLPTESSSVRCVREGDVPDFVPLNEVPVRQNHLKELARSYRPTIKP